MTRRGLTLLEVVIALLLFSLMGTLLLSGQDRANDAIRQAEIERDVAELVRLRLDLAALEYEDYRDVSSGGTFPAHVSDRILDEEKALGDQYAGYTWDVEIREVVGAGADGRVEIEGGDALDLLFKEEAGFTESEDDDLGAPVQPDEVDRMLFIRVTVYPPGYEETGSPEDEDPVLRPRSAWTAIHLPNEESEESPQ